MKKLYTTIALALLTLSLFAQAPEKISYQAVIRDHNNHLINNEQVGMKISLVIGSPNGPNVYVETQNPTTNENGLISIEIGSGEIISGSFANINWANDTYFIKTDIDPDGASNYTITGTSQLLSVPYALHAKTAGSVTGNEVNYFPQSAEKGSYALVSFSGNSNTNFSQASPVAFQLNQNTIYPYKIRYINNQKVDVELYIPYYAATGTYDLIINPNKESKTIIENAFLIDWF